MKELKLDPELVKKARESHLAVLKIFEDVINNKRRKELK